MPTHRDTAQHHTSFLSFLFSLRLLSVSRTKNLALTKMPLRLPFHSHLPKSSGRHSYKDIKETRRETSTSRFPPKKNRAGEKNNSPCLRPGNSKKGRFFFAGETGVCSHPALLKERISMALGMGRRGGTQCRFKPRRREDAFASQLECSHFPFLHISAVNFLSPLLLSLSVSATWGNARARSTNISNNYKHVY